MRNGVETIFVRYAVSGVVAAAVHFGVMILLVESFAIVPTLASAIGFCVAVFTNYRLQYHWTFMAAGSHGVTFARYLLVTLVTLFVNTALLWALTEVAGIHYLIAQLVATATVVSLNFTINYRYTFNYATK